MSTIADSARRGKAVPQRRKRSASTSRPVAGGMLWIVAVGVLLAGIVAVNVLVLQLNMQLDGLSRERAELRADNALLRSRLSSASANTRIETQATTRLGLQPADPATTTYIRLAPAAK